MTSYEAYVTYLAVKRHFTRGTYDFFKYHGQVKTSKEVFDARRDIMKFQKMARIKHPLQEYLAVNLRENPNVWVGEILLPEAETRYLKYRKIIESFVYHMGNELEEIGCIKTSLRVGSEGEVPRLLDLYLSGLVSLEVLISLDDLINFTKKFDQKLPINPLWEDISYKMKKFRPFMGTYDKKKITDIVRTHVESYK
jgi:hypothetical protein